MWPDWLIALVTVIKSFFAWFRLRTWMGIPLDLIFRFLFLGGVYWYLRRRSSFATAALVCLCLLLGKEIFDTFAVRSWHKIHWPGFLDFEDVMSGLLGMGVGEGIWRMGETQKAEEVL